MLITAYFRGHTSMPASQPAGDVRATSPSQGFGMHVQAGTYIKEFVHGDEGRTQPNVASLLGLSVPAKCLELDVTEIHMEWLKASAPAHESCSQNLPPVLNGISKEQ